MKDTLKNITLLALALNSAACSWLSDDEEDMFRDRANDYRRAEVVEPLKIPGHLQARAIEDTYDIPQISDNASLTGEFEIPRPDPLGNEVLVDAVRINKLGESQWILIDSSPGEVWPRLRGFLSRNELPVARADAVNGLIESAWLTPAGETLLRERFQFRIEQGVQRETTEVHILQADIRAGEDAWPADSSSKERESVMVEALSQYLADSQVASSSVSMLAQQAMGYSGKVSLEDDEHNIPYVKLELPFVRAWASLGLALQKAEMKITDRNRSEKVYFVTPDLKAGEGEDESGFWAGLFSDDEEELKASAASHQFKVRIIEQHAREMHIRVEPEGEQQIPAEQSKKILKRIKKHLS
jgi:outer membrane protein assembly factor BamC